MASSWTPDTLHEFFLSKFCAVDQKFEAFEKLNTERFIASKDAVAAAMTASEKAVEKAQAATEKRQDASNEIRAAMVDQQANFAPKDQTEFRLAALEKEVQMKQGRSIGIGHTFAVAVQIIATVASIALTVSIAVMLMRGVN